MRYHDRTVRDHNDRYLSGHNIAAEEDDFIVTIYRIKPWGQCWLCEICHQRDMDAFIEDDE